LIPPRHLQQQQQLQRNSALTASESSIRSSGSRRKSNTQRNEEDCLTKSWIWRLVWSKTTVLVFAALGLILLGVGMANLNYQRVNSRSYQQQHQVRGPTVHNQTKHASKQYHGQKTSSSSSPLPTSFYTFWPLTATQIANGDVTFGRLAGKMVPTWYQQTLHAVNQTAQLFLEPTSGSSSINVADINFTSERYDHERTIYQTRMLLRHTRELLDIFHPVYSQLLGDPRGAVRTVTSPKFANATNNNTANAPDETNAELFQAIHTFLKDGYKVLGGIRNVTLTDVTDEGCECGSTVTFRQWNDDFAAFRQSHSDEIIQMFKTSSASTSTIQGHNADNTNTPAGGSSMEKQSPLFWKDVNSPPNAHHLASAAMARLGMVQLVRIQTSLNALEAMQSKHSSWNPKKSKAHPVIDTIHQIRQEIRAVTDQQDLFQDFFIPLKEDPDKSMVLLKETRALLGTIRDDWGKFVEEYKLQKAHKLVVKRKARKKLKSSIEMQWKGFQWWTKAVDLNGVLQQLIDGMERRCTYL
jgi:hypothetical protein